MHFLLVGPGALGCLLSSIVTHGLVVTGDKLSLLDHNRQRADYLTEHGIVYQQGDACKNVSVTVTSNPYSLDHVDVVLLCVKSYDVAATLRFCQPLLISTTLVVFLQNGISHLSMPELLQDASAAFGTTTEGATLLGRGHVIHTGRGTTSLGFLHSPNDREAFLLKKIHTVFAAGGLQMRATESILIAIWAKLFINVGINALTAILACKNGELLSLPGIDERMRNAIDEAVRIAKAEGIQILDDPYLATRTVCSKTAENVSSMLQDIRSKRRTEIDAINGAIVAKGLRYGIQTPENEVLCRQVQEIEASYRTAP